MPDYDLNDLERRMDNTIEVFKKELSGIRSGRANINFLEPVSVNAYGQNMKLRDLSTVSAPEARLITIQVWDTSLLKNIENSTISWNSWEFSGGNSREFSGILRHSWEFSGILGI